MKEDKPMNIQLDEGAYMPEKKKAAYSAALDSRYLIISDSNIDATERPSLIA